jgi:hypothetical protein
MFHGKCTLIETESGLPGVTKSPAPNDGRTSQRKGQEMDEMPIRHTLSNLEEVKKICSPALSRTGESALTQVAVCLDGFG